MLQMLQVKGIILVNITINRADCLVNSLKSLIKIGSLGMFKTI